ncbi:unnamed protein product [Rotaria sp. Silwood1]|nr:unnamed protein product [Rotaria sp. Silwood1]
MITVNFTQIQKSPQYSSLCQTKTIAINNSSEDPTSSKKDKEEFSVSLSETKVDTKPLSNEMNLRELVNTVRTEIGASIDADESQSFNHKFPNTSNNQNIKNSKTLMKTKFALNTAMIGIDPLKLRDVNNTLSPAICIPMYNCESIPDQRFPMGPTFTTISKNEIDNDEENNRKNSMIIQSINTQRGKIRIKLDPQSFGLAPFFSDQYETFIKGPPNSIFFTNYINTFNR